MNDVDGESCLPGFESERITSTGDDDSEIPAENSGLDPRHYTSWPTGASERESSGGIKGFFGHIPFMVRGPSRYQEFVERMPCQGTWPGARRRSYLLVAVLLPFLIVFSLWRVLPFFTAKFGEDATRWLAMGTMVLPISFMVHHAVQRLVNLGMSRWWIIGYLVPPVSIWVRYRCFACPQEYLHHKRMDGTGIFLAIIYWFFTLLTLLVISLTAALAMGAIGSPETQQQFQHALRAPPASQP